VTEDRLRVLVVGAGGREHALAWACARSQLVEEVVCAPGNGGSPEVARNCPVPATDPPGLVRLAQQERIGLVVLGPDQAIAAGVQDALAEAGIPCFGPSRAAGQLETSKSFAKELLRDLGIPTAPFRVFRDPAAALEHLGSSKGPVVVKADGLALGKGAFVCSSPEEATAVVTRLMVDRELGEAGRVVLVEELLLGEEVSCFAICDGTKAVMLPPARDYKRALDGDQGQNTGGMGGFTPPFGLDPEALNRRVAAEIVEPVLLEMTRRGLPYRGCLYVGCMVQGERISVLEFNARFGDPEAEVLLPTLSDPVPCLLEAARGELQSPPPAQMEKAAVGVVAVREPYPQAVAPGGGISGVEQAEALGCRVFHMGTRKGEDGLPEVAGGRVLICVATGPDLQAARRQAYAGISLIHFQGMRYRTDIAL
jgi:phosphoribosylamine--glycine ligase